MSEVNISQLHDVNKQMEQDKTVKDNREVEPRTERVTGSTSDETESHHHLKRESSKTPFEDLMRDKVTVE